MIGKRDKLNKVCTVGKKMRSLGFNLEGTFSSNSEKLHIICRMGFGDFFS
ncbi:hypothetical protein SDC9_158945 [bioreactor metagenome]|uniref:Uncharacterized protein n=1 Tax=bioreactor metagenome TaxID=1076179 RepID=A0A645FBF4_9ZZZZ